VIVRPESVDANREAIPRSLEDWLRPAKAPLAEKRRPIPVDIEDEDASEAHPFGLSTQVGLDLVRTVNAS
jgi:hypothetical protein